MSANYCPHCMKPAAGPRCPHCGGDVNWRGQKGIDLPVGTVLTGGNGLRTYQIGAARGKGGFGITYIAVELNSGRRMAVKEYFPTRCAFRAGNEVNVQTMTGQEDVFQSGMNSFLEEGRMLLSQDDLPSVVHVIDYFRTNGTAYLVMEYLDGVALHTQMTRMGGRIPVNELMPRLAPLMRDIGQLHRRGVIHRDISPDNIMWMPDGTLKLLDFGSARSMENGKSMTVLMKHGFSPIEQYRSKGQGPYTDIYALAATIYYCVTGIIPPAAVERLDEDALQSPAALGAALTVDQETALLWALSIQPKARPQSMEEFASRLYKEAPAPKPQPPVQPGGNVFTAVGARPVTGQNTAYQYNYNSQTAGQYNGQTAGQYNGQTAGQYNGQTAGQYSGQTAGQYNGQTAGQYNSQTAARYNGPTAGQYGGQGQQSQPAGQYSRQGPVGGRTGGGGGNKKILIGGAVAAAVVVLLAVVIIALNGGDSTAVNPTQTISHAPVSDTPFVPTETPDIHTGIDGGGFHYEIVDRSYVVLTGYEAGANFSDMPDYIDGFPVTEIADEAFVGANTGDYVYLPENLETIGARAFGDCSDLLYVLATSNVTTHSTSFSGCSSLWFVAVEYAGVSGWNLPSGVGLYYDGMDTGYGRLAYLDLSDDGTLLIGETDIGDYLLLDAQSWVYSVDLEWCDWICPWALDHPPYSIELGETTLFPYEVYSDWSDWTAPEGSLADMWLYSCKVAAAINDARPTGADQVVPDTELLYAAIAMAEDYALTGDYNTRSDGSSWSAAVEDRDISYAYLGGTSGVADSWSELFADEMDFIVENRAQALTVESQAGKYYKTLGAAYYLTQDGEYYWYCFTVVPE